MKTEREARIVTQNHLDGVANFGADHRSQQSHVRKFGGPWLGSGEGCIPVFVEHSFAVSMANALFRVLDENLAITVEIGSHHHVFALGGVIPVDLLSAKIVGAHVGSNASARESPRFLLCVCKSGNAQE